MPQNTSTDTTNNKRRFKNPGYYWLILTVLFVSALGIRLFGIQEQPYDFHPVKQFRSALTARALYYESTSSTIPSWKKDVAETNLQHIGLLVPPLLDKTAAVIYELSGRELLWAPRFMSAMFWLIGGIFLFMIARKIVSIDAAIFCLAFYLLLPFSVLASQSFQPDSLMVMLMIIGVYAIIIFDEAPSWSRLVAAASISSLAVLIKPVNLPILLASFAALGIQRVGLRKASFNPYTIVFVGIVLGPTVLFYGYNIVFFNNQLHQQANKSFVPKYFLEFRFWDGWLKRIRIVMGYTYFFGGIIGALLYKERRAKALMLGLWVGYFLMCVAFNYPIGTHDYYHLPLIPIVALSIGSIATAILAQLDWVKDQRYTNLVFFGVLTIALFLTAGTSVQARRKLPGVGNNIQIAEAIGEETGHSEKTIHLSPYQGYPLMYYGELSGKYWPYWYDIRDEKLWNGRSLPAAERYHQLTNGYSADYFIVADKEEFFKQQDLRQFLNEEFPKLTETGDYIIFELR